MEQLKMMKEQLMAKVQGEMGHLDTVDAAELGEVVDMIKDLAEAMKFCEEEKYYKKVTEAMEQNAKEDKHVERHYYTVPYPMYDDNSMFDYDRDMDKHIGRMYYRGQPRDSQGRYMYGGGDSGNSSGNGGSSRQYHEHEFPLEMRDSREGRSGMSRRTYMESKEMHKDKASKIKELETYMKELSEDIVEMITDASPEEKQILQTKISSLATKVQQLNA